MYNRVGSITVVHEISVLSNVGTDITTDEFSSTRFSRIYKKKTFSPTVGVNQFDATEYFSNCKTALIMSLPTSMIMEDLLYLVGIKEVQLMMFQMMKFKTMLSQVILDIM